MHWQACVVMHEGQTTACACQCVVEGDSLTNSCVKNEHFIGCNLFSVHLLHCVFYYHMLCDFMDTADCCNFSPVPHILLNLGNGCKDPLKWLVECCVGYLMDKKQKHLSTLDNWHSCSNCISSGCSPSLRKGLFQNILYCFIHWSSDIGFVWSWTMLYFSSIMADLKASQWFIWVFCMENGKWS